MPTYRDAMTEVEHAMLDVWKKEHTLVCPIEAARVIRRKYMTIEEQLKDDFGGIGAGAHFVIGFRPNMISDCVEVICDCGARKDITDLDNW